jgi:S1-C subfamily serine protease
MMHLFARLIAAALITVLLAACGPRELATPDLVERALPGVVAVRAERGETVAVRANPQSGAVELVPAELPDLRAGAGIVLEDGSILTSAHLVEGATSVTVAGTGADTTPRSAELVGVSVCDDLALLRAEGANFRRTRTGSSADLRLGQAVAALGFASLAGAAGSPTATEGAVTWLSPAREGVAANSLFQVSAPLADGGSGGPVLTRDGRAVGLLTRGRYAAPAGYADYVIGIDYAREVAAQIRAQGDILALGASLLEVPAAQAPEQAAYQRYFGPDGASGGLFIQGLSAQAAASSGLQPGDLLVRVGDRPVPTLGDLCGAVQGGAAGVPLSAEALRRSGETVTRLQGLLAFGGGAQGTAAMAAPAQALPTAEPALAAPTAEPALPAAPTAEPALAAPTAEPALAAAPPAPVAALPELAPAELQAARDAHAARRAAFRELFFDTFDNEATKARWTPTDDAGATRRLIYSYYQLTLKGPNTLTLDAWRERPLGQQYIVELAVALPAPGGTVGISFDQQSDNSGVSSFTLGADGAWQVATFQNGALVPERFARGLARAFVGGGGTNYLRVVRTPAETTFWVNDEPVARALPGSPAGGFVGIVGIGGPALAGPTTVIADNFRVLEGP